MICEEMTKGLEKIKDTAKSLPTFMSPENLGDALEKKKAIVGLFEYIGEFYDSAYSVCKLEKEIRLDKYSYFSGMRILADGSVVLAVGNKTYYRFDEKNELKPLIPHGVVTNHFNLISSVTVDSKGKVYTAGQAGTSNKNRLVCFDGDRVAWNKEVPDEIDSMALTKSHLICCHRDAGSRKCSTTIFGKSGVGGLSYPDSLDLKYVGVSEQSDEILYIDGSTPLKDDILSGDYPSDELSEEKIHLSFDGKSAAYLWEYSLQGKNKFALRLFDSSTMEMNEAGFDGLGNYFGGGSRVPEVTAFALDSRRVLLSGESSKGNSRLLIYDFTKDKIVWNQRLDGKIETITVSDDHICMTRKTLNNNNYIDKHIFESWRFKKFAKKKK
jgi:hypothetical protein